MHTFSTEPGFIMSDAMHTEFMMVEDAATWCSRTPACRGFTLSLKHLQDNRVHYVLFHNTSAVTLSGEWISHLKEATTAFAYSFQPGYLGAYTTSAGTDDAAVPQPLHGQEASLFDARRFCDAEPRCAGFSFPRREPGSPSSSTQWAVFASAETSMLVVDSGHVSYLKRRPIRPPHGSRLYTLAPGFLGGSGRPMHFRQMSNAAARRWCSRRLDCSGFTVQTDEIDEDALDNPDQRPMTTFWSSFTFTFASGWTSYIRSDVAVLGGYMQQPAYLSFDGSSFLEEAVMSVDEARWWCDRRPECKAFSMMVEVPPSVVTSRLPEENQRATVTFSSSQAVFYTSPPASWVLSWVTYAKVEVAIRGAAANAEAERGAPISWLSQPGFIMTLEQLGQEPSPEHVLRADEQANLLDVLEWCSENVNCGGFTVAQPPNGLPVDRLPAVSYGLPAEVRTNRMQTSYTKWAPPTRSDVGAGLADAPVDEAGEDSQMMQAAGIDDSALRSEGDASEQDEVLLQGAFSEAVGAGRAPLAGHFVAMLGYQAGGKELFSAFMSVARAEAWCVQHELCDGFSARLPTAVDSRAMVLYMHFSRGGHVVNHPEWVTWRSARAADSDEQQASDEEDTIDGRDAAAKQEL